MIFPHTSMKNIFCLFVIIVTSISVGFTQEPDEIVKWQFKYAKDNLKVGDEVELIFSATLSSGWILYSTDFKGDIGPQPTNIELVKNSSYSIIGSISPILPLKKIDKNWGTALSYFTKKAVFRAKIKIKEPVYVVEGKITGQLCHDKKGICIPFQKTFQF